MARHSEIDNQPEQRLESALRRRDGEGFESPTSSFAGAREPLPGVEQGQ